MSKFKVGDKVRMTKIIFDYDKDYLNKVFEVEHASHFGCTLKGLTGRGFANGQLELFVEPHPTIIKLPNGHKIVINKPYTIYTDGKASGKAKCNPEDEWSTEEGIRIAVERYKENRVSPLEKSATDFHTRELLKQIVRPTIVDRRTLIEDPVSRYVAHVMGNWSKPKTLQERFPIGSEVEMVAKSDKPWTQFEIGAKARVSGYYKHTVLGWTVRCEDGNAFQIINPDDLRLING